MAVAATGCASNFEHHTVRESVADKTCEAQYKPGRQNYLAAIETIIERHGFPNAPAAPLDAFRAEINASYNTVVQRCKTHTHCLETHGYREAKCYMAASDRKDAERDFSDLAKELRRIENQARLIASATAAASRDTSVNVVTEVDQSVRTKQKNDQQNGDDIEDQDVLAVCGDARNLLKARCRRPCPAC